LLIAFSQVHFLQIWAIPSQRGLKPKYYTRHFTDAEKEDKWVRIVAPVGAADVNDEREASGPAPVHAPVVLQATILAPGKSISHTLPRRPGPRKAYAHVIQRSGYNTKAASGARVTLRASDGASASLGEGDGAYVMGDGGAGLVVENVGDRPAEVLLFDIDF
jgi:redox-sensitive bicupin YhaK (pirin superfamily)